MIKVFEYLKGIFFCSWYLDYLGDDQWPLSRAIQCGSSIFIFIIMFYFATRMGSAAGWHSYR